LLKVCKESGLYVVFIRFVGGSFVEVGMEEGSFLVAVVVVVVVAVAVAVVADDDVEEEEEEEEEADDEEEEEEEPASSSSSTTTVPDNTYPDPSFIFILGLVRPGNT
jgi:cytoskeletal protein RodZ